MTSIIELRGIEKKYQNAQGTVEALVGIDLDVEEGEFLAIIGPSGCGKTTLLRILAGLVKESGGKIIVKTPVTNGRPLNALVFQEYAVFPWRTAFENVTFGLEMRGFPQSERDKTAHHYLEKVGLTKFANYYPYQLSGGMKQRIALARALATNPEILLMDEPFGALDAQTRHILQDDLLRLSEEENKTIIYVTHSIEEAVLMGDRIVFMTAQPGKIKAIYPVDLPRPRTIEARTTIEFNRLAKQLWNELVEEVYKTMG